MSVSVAFAERPPMPEIQLPEKMQGEEAIRSLDDKSSANVESSDSTNY